jgi:type IV secretory pathway component VirB8
MVPRAPYHKYTSETITAASLKSINDQNIGWAITRIEREIKKKGTNTRRAWILQAIEVEFTERLWNKLWSAKFHGDTTPTVLKTGLVNPFKRFGNK